MRPTEIKDLFSVGGDRRRSRKVVNLWWIRRRMCFSVALFHSSSLRFSNVLLSMPNHSGGRITELVCASPQLQNYTNGCNFGEDRVEHASARIYFHPGDARLMRLVSRGALQKLDFSAEVAALLSLSWRISSNLFHPVFCIIRVAGKLDKYTLFTLFAAFLLNNPF